jgi:quercetin dioxygenase-like cupin family protein
MVCRLFCATVVVCVAAGSALAQDPIKAEPTHYRLAFENDRVQVVSVHYGPHEKSGLHDHPGGVVVSLTEGHLRFTDETGKVREVFAKPGETRWYPPFKHRVENLGDKPYNAVYVGVKGRSDTVAGTSRQAPPAMDNLTAKLLAEYLAAAEKP